MTMPGAWGRIVVQPICFPSITVPATVMVHGPVYAVRTVPAGTPVFDALGKPVVGGGVELVEEVGEGVGVSLLLDDDELDDGGTVEGDAVTVTVDGAAVTVFVTVDVGGAEIVNVPEQFDV